MRWQFEKTIILQARAEGVQDFREPASKSQIINAGACLICHAAHCNPCLRVAPFHFSSRAEKYRRVAALNMNSRFIDGFARSLDIGRAEIVLPKVTRMSMAQTPATGDARKRMARRCFSAATGACC
jgi:hypothetical protein